MLISVKVGAFLLSLAIIIAFTLAIVAFRQRKGNALSNIFILLDFSLIIWAIIIYISMLPIENHSALILARLSIFFGFLEVTFFFILSKRLADNRMPSKFFNFFLFIFGSALLFLGPTTPLLFKRILSSADNILADPGIGLYIFGVVVNVLLFLSFWILFKSLKEKRNESRIQIELVLIGGVFTFLSIILSIFLPLIFFQSAAFITFAPLYVLFFLLLVAIAIFKFHLFNVRLLVTEIAVLILNFLFLVQLLISDDKLKFFVNLIFLLISIFFSVILTKAAKKEISKTEERVRLESLEHANQKLQELDRQKTEFLTIAAHQLRTPVSIIKNYVSMLQDGDYGAVNADVQEVHKNIGESSEWLVRLGDEFLNIANLEQGQTKFRWSDGDVSLVTDSVVNELEDRAANKDLKLEWQRPTESMHTKMDEEKIRNVIFNFVDNAIKYSDGGTIRINAQVKSNRIYVTVRDEGIGFDKPDEEKLFKKFQRGDNARKREVNSSTGLGLYIARMFVEGHGGEVWAKSEGLGKGSEFGLWLPIK
jgi:signal transduction histidine kinase